MYILVAYVTSGCYYIGNRLVSRMSYSSQHEPLNLLRYIPALGARGRPIVVSGDDSGAETQPECLAAAQPEAALYNSKRNLKVPVTGV
nr:hypothetical protein CFP56_11518 [Quercus suber]